MSIYGYSFGSAIHVIVRTVFACVRVCLCVCVCVCMRREQVIVWHESHLYALSVGCEAELKINHTLSICCWKSVCIIKPFTVLGEKNLARSYGNEDYKLKADGQQKNNI